VTAVVHGRASLRTALADAAASPVVLVPTMGALHAGHRALLRAARAEQDAFVIVSVFVNPLQFGPGEDLDRYPRALDADVAMCANEGVGLVFAPSAAEMYPDGKPAVTVDPGPGGGVLEGEFRPGFFGGVLTVVLKLFGLIRPDVAVFGEKDGQQLALIRRMVTDLDLGVSIRSVPTVRDPDGLALSSRNRYLSAADRAAALALPRALLAGAAVAGDPAATGAEVLRAARAVLEAGPGLGAAGPGLDVDYLALVDPVTFADASGPGPAVLAVAARVGSTRLIDNVRVELGGPVAAHD
jgi:pantoate--beta-alanine ligase